MPPLRREKDKGLAQEALPETTTPRQAAYYSIVQPSAGGGPWQGRAAVPLLVPTSCATSDKPHSVNFAVATTC